MNTTETAATAGVAVDAVVGRDAVKDMLDDKITDAINEMIRLHKLHPQEAAEVLVEQAKAVLNALAWKTQAIQAAEKSLEETSIHLAY